MGRPMRCRFGRLRRGRVLRCRVMIFRLRLTVVSRIVRLIGRNFVLVILWFVFPMWGIL